MSYEAMSGPWGRNINWRDEAARLWAKATTEGGHGPHHEHHRQEPEHDQRRHDHDHGHEHGPGPRGRGGRRGGFGGPGGGPFGFVFPPGPGFGFGGGPSFGRGPKVARGDVREALLALLAEEPMHGYQMIRELDERSGGAWRPSPGSVYPVLSMLADEGLVVPEESGGKRVYRLTDTGQAHVASRAGKRKPWDIAAGPEDLTDLKSVVLQVGAAVVQVARAGNEAQVEAASKILLQTKRDLYRILADDDDLTDEAPEPDAEASNAEGITPDA